MAAAGLSREQMLDRARARDRRYDGRFLTGVLTTKIYCLPSCPARQPNAENVRHFATPQAARSAGLRPCRRCRPDDFYRGHDPERELAARLLQRIDARPGDFADVGALARLAGIGVTKLTALCHRHLHDTPAGLLLRSRVDWACRELIAQPGRRLLDVALDAGFDSASTFHANFRRLTGIAPAAYRRLPGADRFTLVLPAGFRCDVLLRFWGRDPESVCERVAGRTLTRALPLAGVPAALELELRPGEARVRIDVAGAAPAAATVAAHAAAVRLLGLGSDPGPFERRVRGRLRLGRLIRRRPGLRVPRTADPFEALVWTVVGQQVHIGFAAALRRRLAALAGRPLGGGLWSHPTAAEVARIEPADLRRLQFSQAKADCLVAAAAAGALPLDPAVPQVASELERRLLAVRGLGAWSASYILMRGFGFADCAPAGDVGLRAALQRFFDLDARPDATAAAALMLPFAPYRSYATSHLWSSLDA